MNRNALLAILVTLVALDLLATGVAAQGGPLSKPSLIPPAQSKSHGKLSYRLDALARSATLRAATRAEQSHALGLPEKGAGSLTRDARGQLLVQIRMSDSSAAQLQSLSAAGAQIVSVSDRYQVVSAYVDASKLTSVAAITPVQNVMEVLAPLKRGITIPPGQKAGFTVAPATVCPWGNNVSEGDTQLNAVSARSTYSITGTGITVGVLSDSYNVYTNAPTHAITDVTSGDLPGITNPCGFTTTVNVVAEGTDPNDLDEGRALLQIVHDLAPGAALQFATGDGGVFVFANNIRALRTAGASMIADDLVYFDEPFFQDGPVSVAISDVVGSGALYFTAAGNENIVIGGNQVGSYETAAYRPTSCPVALTASPWFEESCHNFNPSGGTQGSLDFTLANNKSIIFDLQWAQPWYGVTTDLDLFITDNSGSVVAASIYDNPVSTQKPFEAVSVQNNSGSTQTYHLYVARYTAEGFSGTPRFKLILFDPGGALLSISPNTSSGGDVMGPAIFAHSASHFSFSVAAVPYNNSNTPEDYSSHGPATHYFGPVVNSTPASPITPDIIHQPDFAASDGVCTTFFYIYYNFPPPACYRIYGTSAATPHAAAIAALLKQKANQLNVPFPRGTAGLVLRTTAQSVSGGDINSVGAGLLDALGATQKLVNLKFLFMPAIFR